MQLTHAASILPERAPEPGELVLVRSRRWLVEEVIEGNGVGSPVVRLACADDDAQGETLEVYWEHELDRLILEAEGWDDLAAKGFDDPRQFAAFLNTLRWNTVTATDPNLFQSPFRAGIRIDAYQMEPLRKALRLPRVNLFIADDTGLGKTIEAGLIASELLLRKKAKTIVVAAPPSVLEQWKAELEERFGLSFVILDRRYVAEQRRERGFGVNPWTTHSRFLVSHNLLSDQVYAEPMRAWLGELLAGSLLILDEAHHAAPSSGGRYGIETKFTRAVRDLSNRFEHRLFLSATPHNGHSNSFSTLLELLDPYRFTRGVKVRGKRALDEVMVRRLKEDLRAVQGGFPTRRVERVAIEDLPEDAPELELSRLLDEYRSTRERRFADSSSRSQAAQGLLTVGLQQRLLSSIEAFARSLERHRKTVEKQWDATPAEAAEADLEGELFTTAPGADDERAELSDEQLEAEEADAIAALSAAAEAGAPRAGAALALAGRERELLDRMQEVAEKTRHLPDAKVQRLLVWIRQNMCPGLPEFGERPRGVPPAWNERRLLIFTENREGTKRYLQTVLRAGDRGHQAGRRAHRGDHRPDERP
jgi:superfamily II DNA or RNA helicase